MTNWGPSLTDIIAAHTGAAARSSLPSTTYRATSIRAERWAIHLVTTARQGRRPAYRVTNMTRLAEVYGSAGEVVGIEDIR